MYFLCPCPCPCPCSVGVCAVPVARRWLRLVGSKLDAAAGSVGWQHGVDVAAECGVMKLRTTVVVVSCNRGSGIGGGIVWQQPRARELFDVSSCNIEKVEERTVGARG